MDVAADEPGVSPLLGQLEPNTDTRFGTLGPGRLLELPDRSSLRELSAAAGLWDETLQDVGQTG